MNDLMTRQTLPLSTFADMQKMGDELAKSGMFGVKSAAGGVALLVTSIQTGMPIFEINRKYHIMGDGKMTMKADAMLAEYKRLGGKCRWVRFDAEEARAVWNYGENVDLEIAYSVDDAKRDGVVMDKAGSAWKNSRPDMLRARLITKALRMICPEVNHGVYTPEEVAEFQEPVDVTQPHDAPKRTKKAFVPDAATVDVQPEPEPTPFEEAEVVDEPQSPGPSPAADFDYGVCPVDGKLKGMLWADMPLAHLKLALKLRNPMMEPQHFEAINAEIQKKGN
jgi:hypothetical protein